MVCDFFESAGGPSGSRVSCGFSWAGRPGGSCGYGCPKGLGRACVS